MWLSKIFVAFVILLSQKFFSYILIDYELSSRLLRGIAILICLYLVLKKLSRSHSSKLQKYKSKKVFWNTTYLLAFVPYISAIPCFLFHNQDIFSTIITTTLMLLYVFYFFLHAEDIPPEFLVKCLCCFAVIWFIIEVVEQNSSIILFTQRMPEGDNEFEIRNDFLRVDVAGWQFGCFLLFYSFQKFIQEKKTLFVVLLMIGFGGIYLTLTRQLIASVVLSVCIGFVLARKINVYIILAFILIVVLFTFYSDVLFDEFINNSKSDVQSNDYTRYRSYELFGLTYNGLNLITILFGNGVTTPNTDYAREIAFIATGKNLFITDVGFVGVYFTYGLLFIFVTFRFFRIIYKNRKKIPLYIKLCTLQTLMTYVMMPNFMSMESIVYICLLMYLTDKSLSTPKLYAKV